MLLKMNFAFLICLVFLATFNRVDSDHIEDKISNYFNSDLYTKYNNIWQNYKASYENSIKWMLQQTFGRKSVNVFRQFYDERRVLSEGVYINDNIVGVLLQNLTLREMPFLRHPDVTFNLPDHDLRVDGTLSKIIMEADYVLFRNKSNIVYSSDLDPESQSPFTSSQVHTTGLVTIVASDCSINGDTLVTLSNTMVHLLQDGFKVQNCKFFIEIYQTGTGHPPVMAPYFSLKQGTMIERLLTPVMALELKRNLEGVVTATINTTAIFGAELISRIRPHHKEVMRKTSSYLQKVVSSINLQTRHTIEGMLQPSPLRLAWDDHEGEPRMTQIIMDNMTLFGLDTAYSSAQGGLLKNPIMRISDKIRFSTMQVRGQMLWKDNSTNSRSENHEFSLEMKDLAVAIRLNVDVGRSKAVTKGVNKFEVLGWREEEFSILHAETGRHLANALAIGYLNEEVPRMLVKHFYSIFEKAVLEAEDPKNDPSILEILASEEGKNGVQDRLFFGQHSINVDFGHNHKWQEGFHTSEEKEKIAYNQDEVKHSSESKDSSWRWPPIGGLLVPPIGGHPVPPSFFQTAPDHKKSINMI